MALLLVSMLLFPGVKATMIQGLMKIGLFQPDVPEKSDTVLAPTSAEIGATTFQDAQGQVFSLASLKGKVVVLNFWATWCPPCKAELPSLNALYEELRRDPGFVFLAVDADIDMGRSGAFLAKNGYSLPLAIPAGDLPEVLFGGTLPTTVILDRAGNIAMQETGATNFGSTKLEKFLLRLKADKALN